MDNNDLEEKAKVSEVLWLEQIQVKDVEVAELSQRNRQLSFDLQENFWCFCDRRQLVKLIIE